MNTIKKDILIRLASRFDSLQGLNSFIQFLEVTKFAGASKLCKEFLYS